MSLPDYPTCRNLDGVYNRVQRYGKYVNRCFTDMTLDEQEKFMTRFGEEGLKRLCLHLAERLREVGDQLDIYLEYEDSNDK